MADDFAAIVLDAIGAVPADLKARVTFRRATLANDPSTGTSSQSSDDTIDGTAVGVPGDLNVYAALGLIHTQTRTLVFVPDVAGQSPDESYVVDWAGETYAVKSSEPTQPSGTTLASTVVIAR